jgi:Fe-S cluster assembly iron-binding protein IscA
MRSDWQIAYRMARLLHGLDDDTAAKVSIKKGGLYWLAYSALVFHRNTNRDLCLIPAKVKLMIDRNAKLILRELQQECKERRDCERSRSIQ